MARIRAKLPLVLLALCTAGLLIALGCGDDGDPVGNEGDNGQTLMIGGITKEGLDGVNELTYMVLRVARDVAMIDPKINLRISKDTDLELLALAAELTRLGLGFPQYSNDDVVIPALNAHGYKLEDARNYTVAACWEFIIPGKGMEIVNIGAVSLPAAVDEGIRRVLANNGTFEDIISCTAENIQLQVNNLVEHYRKLYLPPAPFYSVLMHGCLETGQGVWKRERGDLRAGQDRAGGIRQGDSRGRRRCRRGKQGPWAGARKQARHA